MLKKLFRMIKYLLITVGWTWVYTLAADFLMIKLWNFNFLSPQDWQTMDIFWRGGGIIKSGKDYLFLGCLLIIVPIWFVILKRLWRVNYLNLLLSPFVWYNGYVIRKYGSDSKRIILKNIGKKISVKDELAAQMPKPKAKEELNLEANQIRNLLQEKLENNKK